MFWKKTPKITFKDDLMSGIASQFFQDEQKPTFGIEYLEKDKLNFSLASINHINEYLGKVKKSPQLKTAQDSVVLRAGAYLGEVIRRNARSKRWHWIDFETALKVDKKAFTSVGRGYATSFLLYGGEKNFCFPLGKVDKYLKPGGEENLLSYAQVILLGNVSTE